MSKVTQRFVQYYNFLSLKVASLFMWHIVLYFVEGFFAIAVYCCLRIHIDLVMQGLLGDIKL